MSRPIGPAVIVTWTFAFILELCLMAAFFAWGFSLSDSTIVGLLSGVAITAGAATVWGVFVSPKASVPLAPPFRLTIELALVALAVACLVALGREGLAVALAVSEVVLVVLLSVLGRPPRTQGRDALIH